MSNHRRVIYACRHPALPEDPSDTPLTTEFQAPPPALPCPDCFTQGLDAIQTALRSAAELSLSLLEVTAEILDDPSEATVDAIRDLAEAMVTHAEASQASPRAFHTARGIIEVEHLRQVLPVARHVTQHKLALRVVQVRAIVRRQTAPPHQISPGGSPGT